jgi:hypothetical protein
MRVNGALVAASLVVAALLVLVLAGALGLAYLLDPIPEASA